MIRIPQFYTLQVSNYIKRPQKICYYFYYPTNKKIILLSHIKDTKQTKFPNNFIHNHLNQIKLLSNNNLNKLQTYQFSTTTQNSQQKNTTQNIQNPIQSNIQNNNNQQNVKKYIDYSKISEQNNKWIQQLSYMNSNSDSFNTFSAQSNVQGQKQTEQSAGFQHNLNKYISQKLLKTKYFHSDIVKLTYQIIKKISNSIQSANQLLSSSQNQQTNNIKLQGLISRQQIHLILYTYHLYTKQVRNYKEQLFAIFKMFIKAELQNKSSNKTASNPQQMNQEELQFFVYFRRYLQSQAYFYTNSSNPNINALNKQISEIAELYCQMIKVKYLENKIVYENINTKSEKNDQISKVQRIKIHSKLLENYCLAFPSLLIGNSVSNFNKNSNTQSMKNQQNEQKVVSQSSSSHSISSMLQNYTILVNDFSLLFQQLVDFWLKESHNYLDEQIKNKQKSPNIIWKRVLNNQFNKQLKLIPCLNQLILVHHRLTTIVQPSQGIHSSINDYNNSYSRTKKSQQKQTPESLSISFIRQQYLLKKLNLLSSYLPCQKIQSNYSNQTPQIVFMRIIIFLKKLLGYNTLRKLEPTIVADYLQKFLQANHKQIILSKDAQKRRDIRYLMGQLISRLTSGLWYDIEDRLGKYFYQSKGNRIDSYNQSVNSMSNGGDMNYNSRAKNNGYKKGNRRQWVNLHDV